jgi:streptomycin 3"-adenylyltransferase
MDEGERRQVETVVGLARAMLGDALVGVWLHGSAVAGGLRPASDLDLFVLSRRPTSDHEKQRLIAGLLPISGRHARGGPARSIELSIVAEPDVRPWRYPPRLDFQYGDWLRAEFDRGEPEPWKNPNPDLAVLLTAVRSSARPLVGPPAHEVLEPVPREHLVRAMLDELPALLGDLEGDERNVVLTLARMWVTVATGEIRSKDAAAEWALERLPAEHRPVLERARAIYLGIEEERWDDLREAIRPHVAHVEAEIRRQAASPAPDA